MPWPIICRPGGVQSQPDGQGVQELIAACSGKGQFQDYTVSRWQDDEEVYVAAGYSLAEAKVIGSEQVELPQLAELKQLGLQIRSHHSSRRMGLCCNRCLTGLDQHRPEQEFRRGDGPALGDEQIRAETAGSGLVIGKGQGTLP